MTRTGYSPNARPRAGVEYEADDSAVRARRETEAAFASFDPAADAAE